MHASIQCILPNHVTRSCAGSLAVGQARQILVDLQIKEFLESRVIKTSIISLVSSLVAA
jgi:hypothetical protein